MELVPIITNICNFSDAVKMCRIRYTPKTDESQGVSERSFAFKELRDFAQSLTVQEATIVAIKYRYDSNAFFVISYTLQNEVPKHQWYPQRLIDFLGWGGCYRAY